MLNLYIFLIVILSSLSPREISCRINNGNIKQVLQFGIDKNVFQFNCSSQNDTLAFSIEKDDSNIKEGEFFNLKNRKVAIYKSNQSRFPSIKFWQIGSNNNNSKIEFLQKCGSTIDGHLKIKCLNDSIILVDISYVTSTE